MASLFTLRPGDAEYPATAFPGETLVNRRPALAFDDTTPETCYFTFIAPQSITGTCTVVVTYVMASATSGAVEFEAAFEAVSDGDSLDLDATTSFDTANTGTETVPGTAGHPSQISITMTNQDSIAAGDYGRLSSSRDADDGTNDTAPGDCYVLTVEVRDAA